MSERRKPTSTERRRAERLWKERDELQAQVTRLRSEAQVTRLRSELEGARKTLQDQAYYREKAEKHVEELKTELAERVKVLEPRLLARIKEQSDRAGKAETERDAALAYGERSYYQRVSDENYRLKAEVERLTKELAQHHLSDSYFNPGRKVCEYREAAHGGGKP